MDRHIGVTLLICLALWPSQSSGMYAPINKRAENLKMEKIYGDGFGARFRIRLYNSGVDEIDNYFLTTNSLRYIRLRVLNSL